ncbi:hypothetical protein BDZ97DRAFT_1675254 [Flammula alnicola]|nr:hypothetical protein BDZ97DRAFT_1675254 [Flammula alnicola]
MHEFELGVWKSLFVHLIRILHAAAPGGKLVAELDERYVFNVDILLQEVLIYFRFRHIPQFSQTIRRFTNNVSEMKKLAARDYEDLLQCSIPAFEGLLEEPHNRRLMKLLYRTAEWHGFAKLRVHTDSTLEHLEQLTKEFGLLMRQFQDLSCSQFQTFELPREVAARNRQQQRAQAKSSHTTIQVQAAQPVPVTSAEQMPGLSQSSISSAAPPSANANVPGLSTTAPSNPEVNLPPPQPSSSAAPTSGSRKPKKLNIFTYKFHSLGDYVRMIRMFGGTDSFSTQLV